MTGRHMRETIVFRSPEGKEKKRRRRTRVEGLYDQLIKIFISTVKSELIYVFWIPDIPIYIW